MKTLQYYFPLAFLWLILPFIIRKSVHGGVPHCCLLKSCGLPIVREDVIPELEVESTKCPARHLGQEFMLQRADKLSNTHNYSMTSVYFNNICFETQEIGKLF